MARCVILLADGLRPDAVTLSETPSLHALAHDYTRAAHATTVRPSTTIAAIGALATGVAPATHRLLEPGIGALRRLASLRPVARELARRGLPTVVVAGHVPAIEVPTASALAKFAGVSRFVAVRGAAPLVAASALRRLRLTPDGLVLVYVNDCDRAGHTVGWMSPAYLDAVRRVDAAVSLLRATVADSLLVVLADHGGGGVAPTDHDAPHPVNDRIPLILAGPRVRRRCTLQRPASLLDVPPTLLWWLGVEVPVEYEGRVLREALTPAEREEAVA
jgi:predicted AlkP superfamily pyrophosphatase or phosphodiesterase